MKNDNYISYKDLFENIKVNADFEKEFKRQTLLPKSYEIYSNKTYRESFEAGDLCLLNLRKTVHEFGIKLTFNQIKFVEDMIRACLKFIFRTDFEQNVSR